MREVIIGVDLGATKILAGIGTEAGQILYKTRFPTPAGSHEKVIEAIVENIKALISKADTAHDRIKGIAVAAPGPISFPEAVVMDSPNLAWQRVELGNELTNRLKRPVFVDKDTNLAAWGEYHFGQQGRYSNLIYITVSTGIGAGIIINGRLYHGALGGAGEIGHMVIDPDGPWCRCGRRGCLEALASGTAIARQLKSLIRAGGGQNIMAAPGSESPGGAELGRAARQGEPEALAIVHNLNKCLGAGLTNLVNIFNPDIVVLGGGVIFGLKDLLLEPIKKQVFKNAFSLSRQELIIEISGLGDDIGLYGCIAAINNQIN